MINQDLSIINQALILNMTIFKDKKDNSLVCISKLNIGYDMWSLMNKTITINRNLKEPISFTINDKNNILSILVFYSTITKNNFYRDNTQKITLTIPEDTEIKIETIKVNKIFTIRINSSEIPKDVLDRMFFGNIPQDRLAGPSRWYSLD